jgi:shikimate dehydrogenase
LGINVTIPYKQDVIPLLDEIDDMAREIGAVNTIVNRDGKIYGYNTDYYGMRMLFSKAGIDPYGKKAAILGSGGTSKTAYAVLKSLGAKEILKVSRNPKNQAISYEDLTEYHRDTEIIINTTPLGMFPNISECIVDIRIFERLYGVVDAVYNPINSTLVQSARDNNIKAEGGLYMLIGQAIKAAELFLDKELSPSIVEETYNFIKKEKENLVLVGMPACGKSTVGKIVADRLSRRFVDTDDIITEKIGMEIKDYFTKYGEEEFRKIEKDVISSLA